MLTVPGWHLPPVRMPSSGRTSPRLAASSAGRPPAESSGPELAVPGASPSARRATGGIPRPSANASNVEVAVGMRLRVLYSLSRPCGIPVRAASWPCVMPCAHRTVITAPRSRRLHASSTSLRVQTRSTISRMAGMSTAMARFPFPWLLACRGVATVCQSSTKGNDEFRQQVQPHRERHLCGDLQPREAVCPSAAWKTSPVTQEASGTGADISFLASVRDGNKLIGVIGDDVDVGERQHRLNSFRWPDSTAGHREQRPSRNSAMRTPRVVR